MHWKTNSNCSHSISFRLSIWMKGAKEVSPIWARIMRKSRGRVCIGPTSKPVIWNRQLQARRSVWNICWQAAAFQGLQRFRGFEGCGLRLPCKANTHAWVKSLLHSNQMGGGAEAMSHCLPNAKGYTRWRSDRKRDRHAADMGNYSPFAAATSRKWCYPSIGNRFPLFPLRLARIAAVLLPTGQLCSHLNIANGIAN